MAIAHRDTQQATGAATAAVTKPTGTVDGDLLVALAYGSGGAITPPAGWTQVHDTIVAAPAHFTSYWRVASGEGASFSFSATGTVAAIVSCFSGAASSLPLDVEGSQTALGNVNITGPSVTTTQANDLLVFGGFTAAAGATVTPPPGMTEPVNGEYDSGTYSLETAYLLDAGAAGATGNKVAVATGAGNNTGYLAAYKIGASTRSTNRGQTLLIPALRAT